ncbi:hypothetical protein HanIR_Chr09g0394921 [Helianthus annuus]|nr:hypothetical protein HanIR_Chr09g0394921 [Helianthus annuus]
MRKYVYVNIYIYVLIRGSRKWYMKSCYLSGLCNVGFITLSVDYGGHPKCNFYHSFNVYGL